VTADSQPEAVHVQLCHGGIWCSNGAGISNDERMLRDADDQQLLPNQEKTTLNTTMAHKGK
jgi:hypothetical protein